MSLLTNLYGYYKLDEASGSALDASGNGRTMANFASAITSGSGIINNGRQYPGTQAYFTGGAASNFSPGAQHFSFSVWVNLSSLAFAGGSGDVGIVSKTGTADNKEYILWFQSAGDKKWHFFCSNDGVTNGATVVWATAPLVNTWYHIAGGWDGANVWLSVNAGTRITSALTGSIPPGNVGFQLGFEGGSSAPLSGKIDEFGFWIGKDLTTLEVTQLYNSGNGLPFASFGTVGGTIRPSDGTPSGGANSIQSIHDSAACVDGDIITMPSGTFVWNDDVTITKGITLIGNTTCNSSNGTAVDLTIIQDSNARRRSGGWPFMILNTVLGKNYRVSGLTFDAGAATIQNRNGAVVLDGRSRSIRVDNLNWHQNMSQDFGDGALEQNFIQLSGSVRGVVDHCIFRFINASGAFHCDNGQINSAGVNDGGDQSFATDSNFGTDDFMFIEDNYFDSRPSTLPHGGPDDLRGGRWVWRYNHMYDVQVQSHGTEDGRWHGGRSREIYNNDFHHSTSKAVFGVGGARSGVILFHDNTFDGAVVGQSLYTLEVYRAIHKWPATPFFGATGDNPWDVNDPGGPFDSGTATQTTNQNTLVDGTQSWTLNQWVGFTAKYTGPAGGDNVALIRSNTSNTLTITPWGSDAGGPHFWATGDTYEINKVLVGMDQPGRGQADLLTDVSSPLTVTVTLPAPVITVASTAGFPSSGITLQVVGIGPVSYTGKTATTFTGCTGGAGTATAGPNNKVLMVLNTTTNTATWPNQVLDPCYSWNNFYEPGHVSIGMVQGASGVTLVEGRDFYNDTAKPGYTPYIHPHPLVTGGGPVANKNITLTGPGLAFGNVIIGGSSPTATLTVANNGDTLLTVTAVTYPTGFTGATGGFTVGAGASFDITVTFTPLLPQLYSGNISVTSDATTGTGTIACSGTGVIPTPPIHGHKKQARDPFQF